MSDQNTDNTVPPADDGTAGSSEPLDSSRTDLPADEPASAPEPQTRPEDAPYPAPAAPLGYTQHIPQPPAQQPHGYDRSPGTQAQAPYGYQQVPYGQPYQPPQPPFGQPAGGQQPPAYGQPYQPPQQPFGGSAYQPPHPPYPPYGAYGQAQQPPKKKVWPWVLVGCLLIGLLGLGGCVGCVACTAVMADSGRSSSYYDPYDRYDYDYGYNYDFDNGLGDSSPLLTYSYSEITADKDSYDNVIENGRISNGIYEVGADFAAGRYFFEGDPDTEGRYIVYKPVENGGGNYELRESVVYFGNYYADLEAGDIIVFSPAATEHAMTAVADASFAPAAPYRGGLYLVGTDIPAGTYTVEYDESAAANATMEAAAYIMKDLEWDDDSITNEYYAVKGTHHTVTVTEGQWIEAYAVKLVPSAA